MFSFILQSLQTTFAQCVSSIFDFLEGYDNGTMSDEESSDDEIRPTRSQRSDNEASRRAAMRKRRLQERRKLRNQTKKIIL